MLTQRRKGAKNERWGEESIRGRRYFLMCQTAVESGRKTWLAEHRRVA